MEKLTGGRSIGTTGAIGLLDGEAPAKGTGDGVVTAADSANVTRRGANAVEVVRHRDLDGEVLLLCVREAVLAGDIVGHLQLGELGGRIAGLVEVALVRTGAVGVDLVDGDGELGALLHLGHAACGQLGFGLLAHIDVAGDFGTAARVDDVLGDFRVTDDGRVLLAGADVCAVTSKSLVDCWLFVSIT